MPLLRLTSKDRFLFVLAALILLILGLTVFFVLISALPGTARGEKSSRNPAAARFALLRGEPYPTPTSTPVDQLELAPTPASAPWAILPTLPEAYRGLLTNGSRDEYKVALTFDLCETEGDLAGYDSEIIRILEETQTPATLFLGGLWMRDHQQETLALAANSLFEFGNHSWSHRDFSTITSNEMKGEILLTQEYMQGLLGFQTNLFRLPYGTYNDEALDLINDQGLYIIQWDNVSGDPDPDIGAKEMEAWVLQQLQPGSIIIMHANGRGWHTGEALPGIIDSIRQQGYTFVTISDLLKIEPYK